MNPIQVAAMFMPMVTALMEAAEGTGMSGPDKQAAVAAGAALQYKAAQSAGIIPASIPWELVAPLVVSVENGMITVLAGLFNTLLGKVRTLFSHPAVAKAA